jgi:hypothetical protein
MSLFSLFKTNTDTNTTQTQDFATTKKDEDLNVTDEFFAHQRLTIFCWSDLFLTFRSFFLFSALTYRNKDKYKDCFFIGTLTITSLTQTNEKEHNHYFFNQHKEICILEHCTGSGDLPRSLSAFEKSESLTNLKPNPQPFYPEPNPTLSLTLTLTLTP